MATIELGLDLAALLARCERLEEERDVARAEAERLRQALADATLRLESAAFLLTGQAEQVKEWGQMAAEVIGWQRM